MVPGVDQVVGYTLALAVTLIVEVPIVAAFFRERRSLMVLTCVLTTTATHLLLYFVLPVFILRRDISVLASETIATAAEAGVYFAVSRQPGRALAASTISNVCSFVVGMLVFSSFD